MKINQIVDEGKKKKGLWANIHAKRQRGERMRKKGEEGAPTEKALKAAQAGSKNESVHEDKDPCWDNYQQVGMKTKGGRKVPNCVPKEGVTEETIHVGHRNSKGDWIKTSTHSNYPDAKKAMDELEKQGKKGVQHRYDNNGSIDPGTHNFRKVDEQGVAEGFLNESSSDEAWELVGQPVPEIQQFVKQMGYGNDEQSVAKITSIIDRVPTTRIPAASIPKLKNLANKGNDAQTLKSILQISGRPDAEQQYTRLMQARDAGEGRNRDVSGYLQYVKSGNYDPPVLLKLPTGVYVIGGRTRLYAALALGVPANVKIISASNFKQPVAEGSDIPHWRVEQSDATGRYYVVTGYTDKTRKVWKSKLGAIDFVKKADAEAKAQELNQGMTEGSNGEYDDESGMAETNLHTIARAAQGLLDTIDDKENLPEWVQEKIAKVEGMMVTAWDYLKSQEEQGVDPRQGLSEVSKGTLDRYIPKAVDSHKHAASNAEMSKDDPTKRSYHKDQKRTAEKRQQGVSRALDRMSRNVDEQSVAEGSGNWYIRVKGKVVKDKQFNAIPFPSKETATQKALEIHNKKRIPLDMIKLTQSWMDGPEQGVADKGSLNEGQYEMMMRNGRVKKFTAKDDADAKRIAAGHGAKSVIRLKGGVPAGKVSEASPRMVDANGNPIQRKVVQSPEREVGGYTTKTGVVQRTPTGLVHTRRTDTTPKPRLVPESKYLEETYHDDDEFFEAYGIMEYSDEMINEAEYQGRKVTLNKPMRGDVAKFKVFVRDPKTGNVKKVNFGQKGARIKKHIPGRRKNFRARHNCDNPGPKTGARYWSCRAW